MVSVKLVCDIVAMYFSFAEPERDYMYFTKAASIESKADILLLVKSFSCN